MPPSAKQLPTELQAHLLQAHLDGAFFAWDAERRALQGRQPLAPLEHGIGTTRVVTRGQLDRVVLVHEVSPLAVICASRTPGAKGGAIQFFGQFGTVEGAQAGIEILWFMNVVAVAPIGGLPQPALFMPVGPLIGRSPEPPSSPAVPPSAVVGTSFPVSEAAASS